MNEKIKLGDYVEDTLTHFSGCVTAKAEYLKGTTTYLVEAEAKDQKPGETKWVEEGRLEVSKI
jgi:hypothetical protein